MSLVAVFFVSCSKEDDIVGGRDYLFNEDGRRYMMNIADNLITDAIYELENVEDKCCSAGDSYIVTNKTNRLCGLDIVCANSSSWTLSYEGDYEFGGKYYPTSFHISAHKATPGTNVADDEEGWILFVEGKRYERDGFWCTFSSSTDSNSFGAITYINTRGAQALGWDVVKGDIMMRVFKYDESIDNCILSFSGAPSQAVFTCGL